MRSRLISASLCLLALVALAAASQMIARNAAGVSLKVGKMKGIWVAVITYKSKGKLWHTLAWNAQNHVDFRDYNPSVPQYSFQVSNAGGYKTVFGSGAYKTIKNVCKPNGSLKHQLHNGVAACTMPDGSHWALQNFQRLLPDWGGKPHGTANDIELHLSHFTTQAIPVLWMKLGWEKRGQQYFQHIYGTFSAAGKPVYGKESTHEGVPLDTYGRNVYVDVKNACWTKKGGHTQAGGWIRWNGFLSHGTRGDFCPSVYPKQTAKGCFDKNTAFRSFSMGPGLTPIAYWIGPAPGSGNYAVGGFKAGYYSKPTTVSYKKKGSKYDAALNAQLMQEQQLVSPPGSKCNRVFP